MSEVRVRIAVGSARLEYVGSRALFDRSIAPLMDALGGMRPPADRPTAGPSASAGEPGSAPAAGTVWTPASPQHFVQFTSQVGPRAASSEQRLMAFAFYLWNYEKEEVCTREQIEGFFRTTQEEPPADLTDRLGRLCDRKRFLESAGAETWRLTTKGVNYVKNRLLVPT